MINKILSYLWAKKWFVLPLVLSVPLLIAKLFGGLGRSIASLAGDRGRAPVVDPEHAEAERERIREHGEAARDAVNERADKFQAKLDRFKGGK